MNEFIEALDYMNLLVAVLDFSIAAVIVREVHRLRLGFSVVVVVLACYFVVRGVGNISDPDPLTGHTPRLGGVVDLLTLPLVVVLLVNARWLVRAVLRTVDESAFQAREYERARRDYYQLVRHRIFNPLTVIRGAATTLKAGVPDENTRDQLLDAICSSANLVEEMTLEPERRSSEERSLDAVPRVD